MLLIVSSCLEDADCLKRGDNALVISFKKLSDGKADTVVFYNVSAEGADSVFYKSSEPDELDTLSAALLAVNPYGNETLFTFTFESASKTLKVGYKNEIRFVSEECGSEQIQFNLTILETQFDSVRVVNSVLSTSRATNIEIYN